MNDKNDKIAKVHMKNGFYFEGKYLGKDNYFIEIIDRKTNQRKMISLSEISNIELVGSGKC